MPGKEHVSQEEISHSSDNLRKRQSPDDDVWDTLPRTHILVFIKPEPESRKGRGDDLMMELYYKRKLKEKKKLNYTCWDPEGGLLGEGSLVLCSSSHCGHMDSVSFFCFLLSNCWDQAPILMTPVIDRDLSLRHRVDRTP